MSKEKSVGWIALSLSTMSILPLWECWCVLKKGGGVGRSDYNQVFSDGLHRSCVQPIRAWLNSAFVNVEQDSFWAAYSSPLCLFLISVLHRYFFLTVSVCLLSLSVPRFLHFPIFHLFPFFHSLLLILSLPLPITHCLSMPPSFSSSLLLPPTLAFFCLSHSCRCLSIRFPLLPPFKDLSIFLHQLSNTVGCILPPLLLSRAHVHG